MTKAVLVRFPEELVREIDREVKIGRYSNRTDFLKDATRQLIRENKLGFGALKDFKPWKGKSAVQIQREMRKSIQEEFLKKAGGDEEKAWDLLFKEIKKVKMP